MRRVTTFAGMIEVVHVDPMAFDPVAYSKTGAASTTITWMITDLPYAP
jgi:hypothetical protein